MDTQRFDALVRSLAARFPRRGLLVALGSVGPALAAVGDDAFAAKSGKCKPRCAPCQRCQKGKCRRTKSGKKRCKRGKCKPSLASDPRNCGACGNRCHINAACERGTCTCVNGACNLPVGNCCPATASVSICTYSPSGGALFDAPTNPNCLPLGSCPTGTSTCVGGPGTCQACCPPGTCDTSTGTCLQ